MSNWSFELRSYEVCSSCTELTEGFSFLIVAPLVSSFNQRVLYLWAILGSKSINRLRIEGSGSPLTHILLRSCSWVQRGWCSTAHTNEQGRSRFQVTSTPRDKGCTVSPCLCHFQFCRCSAALRIRSYIAKQVLQTHPLSVEGIAQSIYV